jgi:hypothetical protein
MRISLLLAAVLLAGCATDPRVATAPLDECRAQTASLSAQLAAEIAERERMTRAARRREDAMRRQLDALKAIERGILEREDRVTSDSR